VLSKVDVQEGQIVPAGAALVEIASGNRIEASLGVEPADAAALKVGQRIDLAPVGAASNETIPGQVRLVAARVDPATRLATVLVTLPPDTHLMLDSFVTGALTRASADDALIVPRDAVLPREEGDTVVYTVVDDHAKQHVVRIGLENGRETQVIADDLKTGDPVVVGGNYVLEDGMDVKVKEAEKETTEPATAPATTEPATTAPAPATGGAQ
jgi:RND family efflux transporter MFP subunit